MAAEVHLLEPACAQYSCVVDHHVESASGRLRELADPLCHFIGVGDVEVADDRLAHPSRSISSASVLSPTSSMSKPPTVKPFRANVSAVALPIPAAAPVMNTVFCAAVMLNAHTRFHEVQCPVHPVHQAGRMAVQGGHQATGQCADEYANLEVPRVATGAPGSPPRRACATVRLYSSN